MKKLLNSMVNLYLNRYTDRARVARIILGTPQVDPVVIVPATEGMKKRIRGCFRSARSHGMVLRLRDKETSVSLCPTGIGAPSTEIIVNALIAAGARILLRFDVCGGMLPGQDIGHLFIADNAVSHDGVSGYYQREDRIGASERLSTLYQGLCRGKPALAGRCSTGTIATVDIFFAQSDDLHRRWATRAQALDMETAALYAIASVHGVDALSVMTISDIRLHGKDAMVAGEFDYMAFRSGMKNMLDTIVPFCRRIEAAELLNGPDRHTVTAADTSRAGNTRLRGEERNTTP